VPPKELPVPTFLVFRNLPGVTRDQYAAAQQALIHATGGSAARGAVASTGEVRYLGGFFLPGAGRVICVFDAESAADVRAVNERAGVPFAEMAEAIELLR
jgi:hypothetical protein